MRDAEWRRWGVEVRRVPVKYTQADRANELEAWLKVEVKDGLGFGRWRLPRLVVRRPESVELDPGHRESRCLAMGALLRACSALPQVPNSARDSWTLQSSS
jgi:hypothetical protein